jgi:hypothetical protein
MFSQTCMLSVQYQNRFLLTVKYETEVWMTEEYTITYIYWVHESNSES